MFNTKIRQLQNLTFQFQELIWRVVPFRALENISKTYISVKDLFRKTRIFPTIKYETDSLLNQDLLNNLKKLQNLEQLYTIKLKTTNTNF